ncbi:WD repeat-containing protein 89 [Perkinsus chesapeaki]|uniref:WD repeat-containing protein 89 n=1 Tax=Perkinsus chesapeaki TaxID=330153 RepID=A0A7J6N0M5_PERCH|nr:WD repeat-containing protein 89 [Perkinsus chesapeaki]
MSPVEFFPLARHADKGGGYILRICLLPNSLAVASQQRVGARVESVIRILDQSTLAQVTLLPSCHSQPITDLQVIPETGGRGLVSCSRDATAKIWDLRADPSSNPAASISVSNNNKDAQVFGASVNNNNVLAVGSDSDVLLFDMKAGKKKPYFTYTDAHMDIVNCVRFHPTKGNLCLTGGEDTLVNVLDVADLVNEDDGQAPKVTISAEDSVRSVCSAGKQGELIVASTCTEKLQVWNAITAQRCLETSGIREHPLLCAGSTEEDRQLGYIIDAQYDAINNRMFIIGGSTNGTVVCCELLDTATLTTHGVFHTGLADKGHEGVVRSAVLDTSGGSVFTGGEDGVVVSWGPNAGHTDLSDLKDGRTGSNRASRGASSVVSPY